MLPVLANFRALAQQFIQGDMLTNVFKTARQLASRPDPGSRMGTAGGKPTG